MALTKEQKSYLRGQYFWNIVFSLIFIALLAVSVTLISDTLYFEGVGLFDLTIISLAAFRLIRLFGRDKVTHWMRALFFNTTGVDADGNPVFEKPAHGIRRTIADLLKCEWCLGVWAALLAFVGYYGTGLTWVLVMVLAFAGVASLLRLVSERIAR